MVGAAAWFLLATLVAIPAFRGGEAPRQFTGVALLASLVMTPGALSDFLTASDSLAAEYVVFLLRPFAFLSLAGPAALLVAVPSMLLNFLGPLVGNDLPVRPQAWYAAAVLPLVALAAVDGVDAGLGRSGQALERLEHRCDQAPGEGFGEAFQGLLLPVEEGRGIRAEVVLLAEEEGIVGPDRLFLAYLRVTHLRP